MFLICGEALFDVFVSDDDRLDSLTLKARVGGSPFNVAVGMARLGVRNALLTGVSNDLFGNRLASILESEGVDTEYLIRTERRTTLSVVGVDDVGLPSYSFYGAGSADCSLTKNDLPSLDDSITGLHFGSYSIAVEPVADAVAELASRKENRFMSLDPNVRPSIEPDMNVWRRRIDILRQSATLIKVSDEDLTRLYPDNDPVDIIRHWAKEGPKMVVLTRGANEIVAVRGGDLLRASPPEVTVVDTVGAGDAFQASLLASLSRSDFAINSLPSERLQKMLSQAGRAAAITCTRRGADPPSHAELIR